MPYKPLTSVTRAVVGASATTLTPPDGADALVISCETVACRWNVLNAATSTVGIPLAVGQTTLIEINRSGTVSVFGEGAVINYFWVYS